MTDAERSDDFGHIVLANCEDTSEYMNVLGKGAYTNGLLAKVDSFTYNTSKHYFTVKLSVGCDGKAYATREFQVINANQTEPS